MFRCTGYHLVTLDHSLCAIWSEKGHLEGTVARMERVWKFTQAHKVSTFPVEFWGQKRKVDWGQGVLAC